MATRQAPDVRPVPRGRDRAGRAWNRARRQEERRWARQYASSCVPAQLPAPTIMPLSARSEDGAHRLPDLRPLPPARAVRLAAGRGNPSPATEADASDGKRGRRLDRWERGSWCSATIANQKDTHERTGIGTNVSRARPRAGMMRRPRATRGASEAGSVRQCLQASSWHAQFQFSGGPLVPASAAPRMRSPICAWAGQRTGKRRGGGSRARCVSGPWVVGRHRWTTGECAAPVSAGEGHSGPIRLPQRRSNAL